MAAIKAMMAVTMRTEATGAMEAVRADTEDTMMAATTVATDCMSSGTDALQRLFLI